jgi:tRNA A37 threonylcarbamoyltransferase TsaD
MQDVSFSHFVTAIAAAGAAILQKIKEEKMNEKEDALKQVQETIATLQMLKEKTKGNLSEEEGRLLEHLLYTLRMSYIEITR